MAPQLPTRPSPLMSVVDFDSQLYYTSQYFHRQYIANSDAGKGKYRQHQTFVRMLKAIEAYPLYLAQGDIIEFQWSKGGKITSTESVLVNNVNILEPLFRETRYKPILLISATAQAALTHHLDDELSKKMSVAINTQAARSAQHDGSLLRQAKEDLLTWIELAAICEAPKYIALIEGAKDIRQRLGIDLAPVLQVSAALDAIPDEQVMLEPTEIGKRLGLSGADVNKRLQAAGVQARMDGEWKPTDIGREHCYRHAWSVGSKTGFNLKWDVGFVEKLLTTAPLSPSLPFLS